MILSDNEVKKIPWDCPIQLALITSHLEANARIRELEADLDRWFWDHRILSEAFIRQCDRADRLAVIADALAVEVDTWQHDSLLMSDKKRADRTEVKLRKLYGYLLQADKDGESNIPQKLGNEIEEILR